MKTTIKYDLSAFNLTAKKKLKEVEGDLKKEMQKIADFALEETVLREPIDEGNLQHSTHNIVEETPNGIKATVYIQTNSPASEYAIPMHEDEYKLGPVSQQKQDAQTEKVGRKYMERAFYNNKKKIQEMLKKALKKVLR